MQTIEQVNKSSIDFLLTEPKKKDSFVFIEPKTFKTDKTRVRKILRPVNPLLSLKLIQKPSHAKVTPRLPVGVFPPFGEHRPIHPPPVLQLKVDGFNPHHEHNHQLSDEYLDHLVNPNDPKSVERVEELKVIRELRENKIPSWTHYSTFFVIARLCSDDENDVSHLFHSNIQEDSLDNLLIGTKVSSGMCVPLKLASPSNSYLSQTLPKENLHSCDFATTFVFSDLSVRKVGKFKLRFDLFEVFEGKISKRSQIFSNEFQVYTPKKFPGSSPSTSLTSFLFKQGARIRQRKRPSHKVTSAELVADEESERNSKVRKTSASSMLKFEPQNAQILISPTKSHPASYQYPDSKPNLLPPLSSIHHNVKYQPQYQASSSLPHRAQYQPLTRDQGSYSHILDGPQYPPKRTPFHEVTPGQQQIYQQGYIPPVVYQNHIHHQGRQPDYGGHSSTLVIPSYVQVPNYYSLHTQPLTVSSNRETGTQSDVQYFVPRTLSSSERKQFSER
jgi:hypothetical protein